MKFIFAVVIAFSFTSTAFANSLRCYGWESASDYSSSTKKDELFYTGSWGYKEFHGITENFEYVVFVSQILPEERRALVETKITWRANHNIASFGPPVWISKGNAIEYLLGIDTGNEIFGAIGCEWN